MNIQYAVAFAFLAASLSLASSSWEIRFSSMALLMLLILKVRKINLGNANNL